MTDDREITKAPEVIAYLAHPYGGNPENISRAAALRQKLQQNRPQVTIFSPVEHFSPLQGLVDEPQVMRHCLTILGRCDALWVAPGHDRSLGCAKEIAYAIAHGVPVVFLEGGHE